MMYNSDVLIHEGVGHDENPPGRGSGRFAWGSGENPYQHQLSFTQEVKRYRKKGLSDAEIAKVLLGEYATSRNLKAKIAIEEKRERQIKMEEAMKYLELAGGNKLKAAKMMGVPPSSYYKLVDPVIKERTERYDKTAEYLKNKIAKTGQPLDVSPGTELYLNVTEDTKKTAIAMLEEEGYIKARALIPQQGTNGKKTTVTVLCPPGTDVATRMENGKPVNYVNWRETGIATIEEFSPDQGKSFFVPKYPASLDSKRVYIRYGDQGGSDMDGVMEIRKGVADLSLGNSNYAQLRVLVDNDHYMKGMAIYSDDIPEGYDVVYNTNKKTGASYDKVFKGCKVVPPTAEIAKATGLTENEVKKQIHDKKMVIETVDDLKSLGVKDASKYIDKDNPFGASIKAGGQYEYTDKNGKKQLSPVNKLTEEGDWDSWSKNLSAQFLSKQSEKLITQQTNLSVDYKKAELDQIKSLTNPVIKKKLLEDFARQCDANAADLSVKGFKNQAFQVILPIKSLPENEIYAPRYKDGDEVILVRYPHAGIFEIPTLKVNNKSKAAKSVMGNAMDAVGINAKVAELLSGADFDGDTVLVIPTKSNNTKFLTSKPLVELKGFDTKMYKDPDDKPTITNKRKQQEMGKVTNLIADMTLGGANPHEIARAVKHSMVVIDSEKHHLRWKDSEKENDIVSLKKKWQGVTSTGGPAGASTIITRAKGQQHILDRKEVNDVKKMTPEQRKAYERGEIVYVNTGKKRYDRKSGTMIQKTIKVHGMDTVTNAMDLVRDKGNEKEVAYAKYANNLKSLANEARREARSIKAIPVSREAKVTYAAEVESLNNQLKRAKLNQPRERKAQEIAAQIVSEKFKSNPEMDYEHKQRERARAINYARSVVGAKKDEVYITDREWEAIQANAISTNKLTQILNNTNQDRFKQLATPRNSRTNLSSANKNLIRSMYSSKMYTIAEIAESFGVSPSTISRILKGDD